MRDNGAPIILLPGGKGERDLIEAIIEKVETKNVGVFSTVNQVKQEVRKAIEEALYELKAEVEPM